MVISLNCLGRAEPDELQSVLPALAEVAERVDVPQARLGVVLDWVQYRRNLRDPVAVRRFHANGGSPHAQIALDMRRVRELDREALVREIVGRLNAGSAGRLFLEDWVAPSKSVIWAFNRSYWRHLSAWDTTFEKDYSAALPGGVSDGTNPAFWRERIEAFVRTLNGLDEWSELPDEIHVLELGVGNGAQARVWLDTFKAACEVHGRDYLERLRYVMADFSPDVLATARRMVEPYAARVDARAPVVGGRGEPGPDTRAAAPRGCSAAAGPLRARRGGVLELPRTGEARGIDRQLAQRTAAADGGRAARLPRRAGAVHVSRGIEHRRPDRAAPRRVERRAPARLLGRGAADGGLRAR
jgi:hypothetical protein